MDFITILFSFTAGYVGFMFLAYRLAKLFFHSDHHASADTSARRRGKK